MQQIQEVRARIRDKIYDESLYAYIEMLKKEYLEIE
jgi:hypothetical protein